MSAKKRAKSSEAGQARPSSTSAASRKHPRKQRPSDLGRALRSVYDDTLREAIPEDFANLIGKLS